MDRQGQTGNVVVKRLTGNGLGAIAALSIAGTQTDLEAFFRRHTGTALPLPGRVKRATWRDSKGNPIDEVLLLRWQTGIADGEPLANIEIHTHGGNAVRSAIDEDSGISSVSRGVSGDINKGITK